MADPELSPSSANKALLLLFALAASISLFLPLLSSRAGRVTQRSLAIHPAVAKQLTPAMWHEIYRARRAAAKTTRWSSPWNHLLLLLTIQRTEDRVVQHIEGFWREEDERTRFLATQRFLILANASPFLLLVPVLLWIATFPLPWTVPVIETTALGCAMASGMLIAPTTISMALLTTAWTLPWIWLASVSTCGLGLTAWRTARTLGNRWAPRLAILVLLLLGILCFGLYRTADPERFRRSETGFDTRFLSPTMCMEWGDR